MAALPRSAKPGGEWTYNNTRAFNIQFAYVDAQTFFGNDQLPTVAISQAILDNAQRPPSLTDINDMRFFLHMEEASDVPYKEESPVTDFVVVLLRMLNYDEDRRMLRTQKELGFEMCGQRVPAEADVCVVDVGPPCAKILLVVREDKRHLKPCDPEPQLISGAVAAFSENNNARRRAGLPALKEQIIPGIVMVGTSPTFYKIPVTQYLADCIAGGQYPSVTTTVERLIFPVPSENSSDRNGMKSLDNRRICLQCFQALRQFLVD